MADEKTAMKTGQTKVQAQFRVGRMYWGPARHKIRVGESGKELTVYF